MKQIKAWVASGAKSKFVEQEIDLEPLGDEEVEVAVDSCGVCHSDLSMLNNEWGSHNIPQCWAMRSLVGWSMWGPLPGNHGRPTYRYWLDRWKLYALPPMFIGQS